MSWSPFVTVVMPCRDEEPHIEKCVRSALAQDWPRDQLEILVADGMSMDSSREILARLASEDRRIQLIDNPARVQAAGLNACVRRARGEVIVRMDVHADYPTDFIRKCVEVLERTADTSWIPDFTAFELDSVSGRARKPDSLYMEARKPRSPAIET